MGYKITNHMTKYRLRSDKTMNQASSRSASAATWNTSCGLQPVPPRDPDQLPPSPDRDIKSLSVGSRWLRYGKVWDAADVADVAVWNVDWRCLERTRALDWQPSDERQSKPEPGRSRAGRRSSTRRGSLQSFINSACRLTRLIVGNEPQMAALRHIVHSITWAARV